MADYKLTNEAKHDLIRIHQFGVERFGIDQADKYYYYFFEYFDIISQSPYSFESVEYIKKGYRRCACGSDNIYCRIEDETVIIVAIIGRQDLKNILQF